ncbi:MAG TPA: DNA recombination protein RmuC [Acidobacteriaceae bacterium]|jgi:DNA recombination protein RmuC|nr:DNA recombination protein RmuC [Acidobacteriaceae bacterium]
MQTWIAALIAAFAGIAIGYWLRSNAAKTEKAQLDKRLQELSAEVADLRRQLAQAQSDTVTRAGFESLAAEREKTIQRLNAEREEAQRAFEAQASAQREQAAAISRLEAQLKGERESAQEKLKLLTEARVELTHQFEALAGKILDEKSSKFTEQNKLNLDQLLNPLRTQITEFRGKVEEAQKDSLAGRVELRGKLESLEKLNQQLSAEAHNLTTALRGSNKAQGDWGEFILRDLLEKAGLREGEQYRFQESFGAAIDEDGQRGKASRTDVIINLPGGRHLVVDSKVSLNAYTDYCNAVAEDLRKVALKQHLVSVRAHLDGLAKRSYHKLSGLESPDFVVMFVPVEPAFLLAMQEAGDLWREAYERNVLLVGPTTLLFVIRIVDNLWQQEQQARSVADIVDRGTKLYEKFVNFVADLSKVGESLRSADQSYQNAMNKLSTGSGNLVRQTEMLKKAGIRTSKQLPSKLLDAAGLDAAEQAELSLAASGEEETQLSFDKS